MICRQCGGEFPKRKGRFCGGCLPKVKAHDAAFLAEQIEAVATLMWAAAERMEFLAGFNGEMNTHAREMAGASLLARGWAKEIRKRMEGRRG
jgi:hypothetical protein